MCACAMAHKAGLIHKTVLSRVHMMRRFGWFGATAMIMVPGALVCLGAMSVSMIMLPPVCIMVGCLSNRGCMRWFMWVCMCMCGYVRWCMCMCTCMCTCMCMCMCMCAFVRVCVRLCVYVCMFLQRNAARGHVICNFCTTEMRTPCQQ